MDRPSAREKAIELLKLVGIPDARRRIDDYPHQFSGGMRQRVMIAMALSCNPRIVIADEPTTALDVTTQAQLLELMTEMVDRFNTSLVIVTHNLGVVARHAARIYVMYSGQGRRVGTVGGDIRHPRHPYTIGLLNCVPRLGETRKKTQARTYRRPAAEPDRHAVHLCLSSPVRLQKRSSARGSRGPHSLQRGDDHYAACYLEVQERQ